MKGDNRMFRQRRLVLPALLGLVSSAALAQSSVADLRLFEDGVPTGMTASRGDLAISGDHYKDGERSLKWTFASGGALTINHPFLFEPFTTNQTDQRRRGIAFWIYSPTKLPGSFRFDFFKGTTRATGFTLKAGFTGWRAAVLSYEGDMTGKPVAGMDRLVITAPAGVAKGSVYFDQLVLDVQIDPRHPAPDYQLPGLNAGLLDKPNSHWTAMLAYDAWQRAAQARKGGSPAVGDSAQIATIESRIDAELLAGPVTNLAAIEQMFRGLHNTDGSLKALGQTGHQWEMYEASGVAKDKLATVESTAVSWKDYGEFLRAVAVAYRRSQSPGDRARLAEIFTTLVHHEIDQGLVRGSGQGLMHHQGYVFDEWAEALFLMRDALGADRDAARESIAWFSGLGRIYEKPGPDTEFDTDVLGTMLEPMLYSVLMDQDQTRRQATLKSLSAWVSSGSLASPGVSGGFKSDGSIFHHAQHYVAYANVAMTGIGGVVYYLAGTRYAISPEALAIVRKSLLMERLQSNRGRIPLSLSGRRPDGKQAIVLPPFRYLALAGAASGGNPEDRELISAYLRLVTDLEKGGGKGRFKLDPLDRAAAAKLTAAGYTPEADPNGSWAMNYAGLVLHRRDGWMMSARGLSRYLVGNEAYIGFNLYGRFINYGALEFMPADPSQRGFSVAGWDWSRWPGTTATHLPVDALKAQLAQVDPVSGIEEMLLSDQSFNGGIAYKGQAVFAMKLNGTPKYDDDMVARKSVFFFDNRVVALGSGITANNPQYPVQTTIFQDAAADGRGTAAVDGVPSSEDVSETRLRLDSWRSAIDEGGNGICLAPGQNVVFRRGPQSSMSEDGAKSTQGRFATLVLDHGIRPQSGSYQYAFLPQVGAAGAKTFCAAMTSAAAPYLVLAQSDRAHIVRDRATGTTGYAVFEPGKLGAPGVIDSVSLPSMLMLNDTDERIEGSFVNPDLNLYQGRDPYGVEALGKFVEKSVYSRAWRFNLSKPIATAVSFKGRWRLAQPNIRIALSYDRAANTTQLTFTTVDAQSVPFVLQKDGPK